MALFLTSQLKFKKMKTIMIITALMLTTSLVNAQTTVSKTFHDFTVTTIDGKEFPLSQLKGKKVLVVNTASKCGYTPQYEDLEKLYETYGGDKFTIIGFPANNFMHQEPGTNEEIRQFCTSQYNVTFPMMAKISVKGDDIAPVYSWLTSKKENGVMDAPVKWNFQKFMIDENGNLVGMVPTSENPLSDKIVNWIKK
jgi:glutathione peroxidase